MKDITREEKITCIICPNGCQIIVKQLSDGSLDFEGAECKRGVEYATNEFRAPKRMLITTMRIEKGELPVIPVRSKEPIPKEKVFEAMRVVNQTVTRAPIKMGDAVISNLLDLGIDVIASRDMARKHKK